MTPWHLPQLGAISGELGTGISDVELNLDRQKVTRSSEKELTLMVDPKTPLWGIDFSLSNLWIYDNKLEEKKARNTLRGFHREHSVRLNHVAMEERYKIGEGRDKTCSGPKGSPHFLADNLGTCCRWLPYCSRSLLCCCKTARTDPTLVGLWGAVTGGVFTPAAKAGLTGSAMEIFQNESEKIPKMRIGEDDKTRKGFENTLDFPD
ncbi:hypothetical protein QBC37DRAFT_445364 [Rhypophila decipiens]|uniref:Uncharacterized protein n=1 Tax=Rhypophila decipiens TaxID=261697 RepID=A0AAN6YPS4_9PEZI|nr:hypothetical protein QBC37DRAFT_445364 [Rhypophila decipiens]